MKEWMTVRLALEEKKKKKKTAFPEVRTKEERMRKDR